MRKRILRTIFALVSAAALCCLTACSDPAAPPVQDGGENNTGNENVSGGNTEDTGNEGGNVIAMPADPEKVAEIFKATYAARCYSSVVSGEMVYTVDYSEYADLLGYPEDADIICESASVGSTSIEFDLQEGIFYAASTSVNATGYYVDGVYEEEEGGSRTSAYDTCLLFDGEFGAEYTKRDNGDWQKSYGSDTYSSEEDYLENVIFLSFPYTNGQSYKAKKEGSERGYLADMVTEFKTDGNGKYFAEVYLCVDGRYDGDEILMDMTITLTVANDLITKMEFYVDDTDIDNGFFVCKTYKYTIEQTIEYVAPELTIKKPENAQSYQSLLALFADGKNEWEEQNSAQ